jgi:hypothetical protein
MRPTKPSFLVVGILLIGACASKNGSHECNGNPDDPACLKPQCSDGIDNDGDGLIDYPNDPGCYAPNQDSEVDDCPSGPNCPECGNGKDDDGNGLIDFSGNDPGCYAASDTDEYTEDPTACGGGITIEKLPWDNHVMGMFNAGSTPSLHGKCGGTGDLHVYELRLKEPKVVVATTDTGLGTADTVLYLRGATCTDASTELACSDDISTVDKSSVITVALEPGTYYLALQAHDSSVSGTFDLQVHFYVGEGTACQTGDDCGPGLVCRVPLGGTTKVCAKHECQDGVDNDGDGLIDYPNDPGCDSPTDDDETDDCPSGPNCPECGNKIDDNHNGKTDYPAEPNCIAASSSSEWCASHEPVVKLTSATTMGNTTGAVSDFNPTCAFQMNVPDLTYRLDVPALDTLTISADTGGQWYPELELLNSTCSGTAIQCAYSLSQTTVAAGTYFVVVDGDSTTDVGPFTLTVAGSIKAGGSCESPLAQSGALVCPSGYACKGTVGSRTCAPAQCSDGIDNNGDGKIDYPNDPGCTDPGDDTEDTVCPGASCPVCSNGVDDNSNGLTDWPAEWGCVAASGTTEVFCMPERDASSKITTKTTTGTTVMKSNDLSPSCSPSSAAPDVSYGLQLPVPVASLQIDTIGSAFDTVLTLRDANCAAEVACDDDSGGSLTSKITLTNVHAGGYAINVDGYSTNSGAFTLNVHGTVAAGTPCSSALFSGGAAAVLSCPTGKTCTGTPAKCQ